MMRQETLVAIVDQLTNEITGPVNIFKHDAAAIRFFGDVASHPESQIGRHVQDFYLLQLGTLNDDLTVNPEKRVILTGAQWKASQQQESTNNS